MSAPFQNFNLYDLRVYTLRKVHHPASAGERVVVGCLKSEVWKVHDAPESPENYETCLDELHRRKGSELHKAFTSIAGSKEIIEEKTQPSRLRIPSQWIEPDLVTASEICIWRENDAFELPQP
jgi:hypothetical protein